MVEQNVPANNNDEAPEVPPTQQDKKPLERRTLLVLGVAFLLFVMELFIDEDKRPSVLLDKGTKMVTEVFKQFGLWIMEFSAWLYEMINIKKIGEAVYRLTSPFLTFIFSPFYVFVGIIQGISLIKILGLGMFLFVSLVFLVIMEEHLPDAAKPTNWLPHIRKAVGVVYDYFATIIWDLLQFGRIIGLEHFVRTCCKIISMLYTIITEPFLKLHYKIRSSGPGTVGALALVGYFFWTGISNPTEQLIFLVTMAACVVASYYVYKGIQELYLWSQAIQRRENAAG